MKAAPVSKIRRKDKAKMQTFTAYEDTNPLYFKDSPAESPLKPVTRKNIGIGKAIQAFSRVKPKVDP